MSDYSIKDHIAYSIGFKDGQESQAATIAGLQAAVTQCRSLTELLKPQADRIAELEAENAGLSANQCLHSILCDEIESLRAALKDVSKHIWRGDFHQLDQSTRDMLDHLGCNGQQP